MTSLNSLNDRIIAFRKNVEMSSPWRRSFRADKKHAETTNPRSSQERRTSFSTRPYSLAGWVVVGVFVFGGILWANFAKLDGAAIAHGTIGVESNRKSVAHLEGGIIKNILVREGDRVSQGQPIIRLDATRAIATLDLLQGRWFAHMAKKARLDAESRSQEIVTFPNALLDHAHDPDVLDLIDNEMDVFETRRHDRQKDDAILVEKIAKSRSDIHGLSARKNATEKRLLLHIEERNMMASLVEDGLIARNRLLGIQRKVVDTEGEILDLSARITRAHDQISEHELEREKIDQRHRSDVAKERSAVLEAMSETKERIRAARDILDRATIIAPNSGKVVALRQHTIGGIVQAGEPLLDIIPDEDQIVFDLRIHPNDIDVVYAGQTARMRLLAFNARTTPMLEGEVAQISADQIIDPISGAGYFHGRVIPQMTDQGNFPRLQPGMQAEVYLVTAERTVMDYLLDPFVRATQRAGREL